jgi:hypothetical protein
MKHVELEQRVKALEQELAVLKHQIQVTLLEVHEQVLAQKHPDLRADGATSPTVAQAAVPSEAPIAAENSTQREAHGGGGNGAVSASQPDVPETLPPTLPPDPVAEPVLDDTYPLETAVPVLAPARADWSEVVSTINWLQESIEQVGIAHTRREIALYVRDGVLPPEVEMPLLELLDLYEARDAFEADRDHQSTVTQVLAELINSRRAREEELPADEPADMDLLPVPPADAIEVAAADESSEQRQMRDIVQRLIYGLENLDAA